MMNVLKNIYIGSFGGVIYGLIEILFRCYTHCTMVIVGGVCFLAIGSVNRLMPDDEGLIARGAVGAIVVTLIELLSGIVINLWLGMEVWDYSNMPLNILGQICLPFSLAWMGVSIAAILLYDSLRACFFGEARRKYPLFAINARHVKKPL
jgi:uncharacterized membrane protein